MVAKRRPMRYAHNDGHTDVCFSSDGNTIFTCGNDGDVRIWAGLEDDDPSSHCVGEQVLAVYHHDDHLYVGSDKNIVQTYTLSDDNDIVRDGIISRYTAAVTHIAVNKEGTKVASASCDMEIQLKDLETAKSYTFSGHKAPVLGVAIDPKGKYLASSSCDGTVRIWSLLNCETIKTWDCIPKCNSFFSATCLARVSWQSLSGSCIAVPDNLQVVAYERDTWEKLYTFADDQVTKPFSISAFSPCGRYLAASTTNGDICIWNVKTQSLVSRSSHDKGVNICGFAWNPIGIGQIVFCDVTGQLGTVEDCIPDDSEESKDEGISNGHIVNDALKSKPLLGYDDDGNDFDLDLIDKMRPDSANSLGNEDDIGHQASKDIDDDLESRVSHVSRRSSPPIDIQTPFQPSSTPLHLQHRYMVWNSVGIVRCQNTESENSIDVEFNDSSIHHAMHINNSFLKHSMGALTYKALVLACEAQDDIPSKVVCVLLNAWDGQKEWTMDLPEGEDALAVAAGDGWIGVATDTRNLRLFTTAGSQREILSLPGPVVSLAGLGRKLVVVYHIGLGLPGNQSLGFTVLNVGPSALTTISPWQPLPIAPNGKLQWLGFSDEYQPLTLDSAGMLRLLSRQGFWMPVCDTQSYCKGKSDHYFIIGMSERYQNIRCVLCRGSHYPPTTPKPLVMEIDLKLPLCEDTTEKSLLEEKFWLSNLVAPSLNEMTYSKLDYLSDKDSNESTIKETILKLFALSARSGLQERALELGGFMPAQVEQLAIKYASKLSKYALADKLREESEARTNTIAQTTLRDTFNGSLRSYNTTNRYDDSYQDNVDSDVDSSENTNKTNGHVTESENLLLVARESKLSATQIKPILILSGVTKKNPFKKSLSKQNLDSGSGLDHLSSSYNQKCNERLSKQYSTPEPSLRTGKGSKSKQTKLTPNDNSSKKPNGVTFVQWFGINKAALKEEFPELNASELTKQGLKRYKETKEEVQKSVTCPAVIERDELPSPTIPADNTDESKKRKLEVDDDSLSQEQGEMKKVTSSSKLKAFAFKQS